MNKHAHEVPMSEQVSTSLQVPGSQRVPARDLVPDALCVPPHPYDVAPTKAAVKRIAKRMAPKKKSTKRR